MWRKDEVEKERREALNPSCTNKTRRVVKKKNGKSFDELGSQLLINFAFNGTSTEPYDENPLKQFSRLRCLAVATFHFLPTCQIPKLSTLKRQWQKWNLQLYLVRGIFYLEIIRSTVEHQQFDLQMIRDMTKLDWNREERFCIRVLHSKETILLLLWIYFSSPTQSAGFLRTHGWNHFWVILLSSVDFAKRGKWYESKELIKHKRFD